MKHHGSQPLVQTQLFDENDDISIMHNELNVMENGLAEQTRLLLSALDDGNINWLMSFQKTII